MTMAGAPVSTGEGTLKPEEEAGSGDGLWLAPAVAGAAYLIFWQVAPRVKSESLGAVLISTVLALALTVWFAASFARAESMRRALLWNLALATVINLPIRLLGARVPAPWSAAFFIPGLPGLLLIWLAASIGALLSRILRSANMIPPVAAVLALVDVWTVLLGGPVQQLINSNNPAARLISQAMMVQLPAPRPIASGATPMFGAVGFADYLFIAFFVAAICRFMPATSAYRRTLWSLIGVLCAYMALVFVKELSLPALAPMAVVMIGTNWRRFHYERSEAFALIYAAIFIALIAGGFWLFGRQKKEPGREPGEENTPHARLLPKNRLAEAASSKNRSREGANNSLGTLSLRQWDCARIIRPYSCESGKIARNLV